MIDNRKLVCKFCKDYEDFKEIDEFGRDSKIKSKYKVRLVQETWKNGVFKGSYTCKSQPLRYCPSCGKELNK